LAWSKAKTLLTLWSQPMAIFADIALGKFMAKGRGFLVAIEGRL